MSLKHCFLIRDVRPISQKAEWQQLWSKASRHIRKKTLQTLKQLTGTLSKWNRGRRHKAFHCEAEVYFCFFFFSLWVAEARWARPTLLLWNLTADGLIRSLQSLVESCSRWIDLYSMNHLFIFSKSLGLSLTARGGSHSRKCSRLNLSTCRWSSDSSDPKCFVMQLGRVCGTVGSYQWNYVAGMEKGKSFFSASTSPSHSLGFTWAANQGKELLSTKNVTF